MAHYAIMRGEKRKTGDVRGMTAHIARSQPTPNADASQQHRNYAVVGPAWDDQKGINDAIEARTPKKHRKDAVRAIEYIVSASPEWFEQNSEKQSALYFESAVDWFQDEFGADNVVSAVVHNDESSPHMHILVVPLDPETGRLNGKRFFGNKGVLQKRQSRFADYMAEFGVERGKADPERTHTKVSEWRAGHAKLDEREASVRHREQRLDEVVEEWQGQFDSREEKIAHKASELAQRERSLDELSGRLDKRENGLQSKSEALQQQSTALAERERQLASLERELTSRGETLAGGEAALEKRQSEIDAAGEKLRQRLAAAKQQQEAFEQQRAAWIADNKPPGVPGVVLKLRKMQHMSSEEARLFASRDDQVIDYWNPMERRLTPEARELLDQYGEAAEKVERWERTFAAPSSSPGL